MNRRFPKYYAFVAGVALIFGFVRALPFMGVSPDHDLLISAARGVASQNNLVGFGAAGIFDHIAARFWLTGGPATLSWGYWLILLLGWALLAFAALVALFYLGRRWPRSRNWLVTASVLLFLGLSFSPVWRVIAHREELHQEIKLVAPVELAESIEALPAGTVFANVSALPELLLFAPTPIRGLDPAKAFAVAKDPSAWREALRQSSWKAVVLAGPLSEHRALLDHLLASPDWRLAQITNQGFLFLREPGLSTNPPDPATFRLGNDNATAVYLAQLAVRLDALRKNSEARACMTRALDLAPRNVTVLSHAATLAVARKRWAEAITYADEALRQDPGFVHAKLVKAMALLETGQADEAEQLTSEILRAAPSDPYTLFLHARINRARYDYIHEAETLKKLLEVEKQNPVAVANYHIHLGQAYTRQGEADLALQSYKAALNSGVFGKKEMADIEETIRGIETNRPR